ALRPLFPFALFIFLFNAPATTELFPLSLHDALPIFASQLNRPTAQRIAHDLVADLRLRGAALRTRQPERAAQGFADSALVDIGRSEEHTSELQSLTNLVCRLLLEKKKRIPRPRTRTR